MFINLKKFLKLYEIRDWLSVYSTPIPPQMEPVAEFKTILQLAKNF